MRYTDEEHRIPVELYGGLLHRAPRMLLQNIVYVLDARDFPFPDAIDAFVKPPDRRPQSNAIVAALSRRLQLLQCRPESIVSNLVHPDIVQLKQVNPVGLETLQCGVRRADDCLG